LHDAGVTASDPHQLKRFIDAQQGAFEQALAEIRAGRKQSHWMWFVFPQFAGLGRSATAQFYAIRSSEEARAYLAHDMLGPRLREAVEELLPWASRRSAEEILGPIDSVKLRSSLTLFNRVEPNAIFGRALAAFFAGPDERTLALLNGRQ
jgi:uncharacterized protein (DUF1810 family)